MATTDNTSPKTPAKPATRKRAPAKKTATNSKASTLAKAKETARPLREEAGNMVSKLKTSAREAAETGKEKTTSALDEVTAMVLNMAAMHIVPLTPFRAFLKRSRPSNLTN